MNKPIHKDMDHEPPDWIGPGSIYFITVCAEKRNINHFCNPTLGPILLESIHHRHKREIWYCHLAVLMPDHIHLLLSFPDIPSFSGIIGSWKHWLTRVHAISWQENFFDHRIRQEESLGEKAEYILMNPVRAGLIDKLEDWPYVWRPANPPQW
jgi:putative transposase